MKLTFGCFDLALDPMIFTSELIIDMVVTYLHAKNWVDRASGSKVITDTHTDRQTGKTFTYSHTQAVKMASLL